MQYKKIRILIVIFILGSLLTLISGTVSAGHAVGIYNLTTDETTDSVTLNATFDCPGIGDFYLEVEVVADGGTFTNSPTHESPVYTNNVYSCTLQFSPLMIDDLPSGTYMWQGRMKRDTVPCCGEVISYGGWSTGSTFTIETPVSVVVAEDGMPLPAFYDGRINDYDTAAPVAVYPHNDGLAIYSAEGVLLLVVNAEQIASAPDNPDGNVLIAEGGGVTLYRITGGYWQINAPQYNGKTYVMIFPELFHSGGYESFELEGY